MRFFGLFSRSSKPRVQSSSLCAPAKVKDHHPVVFYFRMGIHKGERVFQRKTHSALRVSHLCPCQNKRPPFGGLLLSYGDPRRRACFPSGKRIGGAVRRPSHLCPCQNPGKKVPGIFYFGRGYGRGSPFSCKLIFSGRYDILLQKQRLCKRA